MRFITISREEWNALFAGKTLTLFRVPFDRVDEYKPGDKLFQGNRFNHFCASNYSACDVDMECCRCPLEKSRVPCEFAWAHRPIEENNEGATDGE